MKLRPQHVRIFVTPTGRTDLVCIACGGFRTEYELQTNAQSGVAQAGVHSRCIADVAVKFTRGRKSLDTGA